MLVRRPTKATGLYCEACKTLSPIYLFSLRMQHCIVVISNSFNKQLFIQQLLDKKAKGVFEPFNQLDTQLFSAYTVQHYLHKEDIYGYSGIEATLTQTLRSMSSGEQKKTVLHHLLSLQPAVLILDNLFDNLDTGAQQQLKQQLEQISKHTILIQLLHRNREALPFIEKIFVLNEHGEFISTTSLPHHLQPTNDADKAEMIPAPLYSFQLNSNQLVRFKNVSVCYNEKQVVQNINWTIRAGEFWQLKGPNGSGKTTLLTMITGDNVKGYGKDLYIFGRKKGSGESVWEIKEKIGYLTPAMTDLFSSRHTLVQMIVSGYLDQIGLYNLPTDMQKRSAFEWLQFLSLEQKANKPFCDLSPGEQRIALIARAMVKHPPLLILDEPLAGLDEQNAQKVIQLINRIAAASESAILYVSHQTEEGLQPQKVFELITTENGSVGVEA